MFNSLLKRFKDHDVIDLAAQCAYYLLLSIFPFLIFIISLLSFVPFSFDDIYRLLQDAYVPAGVLEVIEEQWLMLTETQSAGLLSLGIIFTLWTASLALNSILRALNLAYHVTEKRGFIVSRLISITLTISMFIVVIIALSLQVIGTQVRDFIAIDFILFDFDLLRWLLSSVIIFSVFLILYFIGPNIRLTFKQIYIGALFATVGWQLTSFGFSLYLAHFADYSATYGTIGTVIVLMVWFHLSSVIILIGGEINAILKEGH